MSQLHFDCRFRYETGFYLDVCFTITKGVAALVGPSGSGKTTILQLISGYRTPNDGRITLGERTLFDSRLRVDLPPERRRVGMVFQDYQLFPHLTIQQNVDYAARRNSLAAVDSRHVLEVLQLARYRYRLPGMLSGGQQQRAALARAIVMRPSLLLLDEPLNAIDENTRLAAVELLAATLRDFPIPALVVTHDRRYVEALAQQTIELSVTDQLSRAEL